LKSSKKARTKHLAAGLLKKNLPSYHPAPLPIANSKQTKKSYRILISSCWPTGDKQNF